MGRIFHQRSAVAIFINVKSLFSDTALKYIHKRAIWPLGCLSGRAIVDACVFSCSATQNTSNYRVGVFFVKDSEARYVWESPNHCFRFHAYRPHLSCTRLIIKSRIGSLHSSFISCHYFAYFPHLFRSVFFFCHVKSIALQFAIYRSVLVFSEIRFSGVNWTFAGVIHRYKRERSIRR